MRPRNWRHDRDSFFKYMPISTANAVLRTQKLRWSSPRTLNDPFDVQFDLHVDFDLDGLTEKCLEENWRVLESEHYEPVGILGQLIQLHRENLGTMPAMSREEFNAEYSDVFRESALILISRLPEFHAKQKEILADTKLLCFTETNTNILMWSHYADLHRGVVLEFKCVPEIDSAWGAAQPVRYSREMPKFMSDEEFAKSMSGQGEPSVEETMDRVLFTKASDWSYEKEWRIVGGRSESSTLYEDIPFATSEFAAVYFGCQTSDTDRVQISALIAEKYPLARIFSSKKNEQKFSLDFREVPILGR